MCAKPTFHFKIIPFPTLQDGMREAEPGSFFAQLWNDVMDDEAQWCRQQVQHVAEHRLKHTYICMCTHKHQHMHTHREFRFFKTK